MLFSLNLWVPQATIKSVEACLNNMPDENEVKLWLKVWH